LCLSLTTFRRIWLQDFDQRLIYSVNAVYRLYPLCTEEIKRIVLVSLNLIKQVVSLYQLKYGVMEIIGTKFAVDFGAKATLEIRSATELIFHISEIDGRQTDETETVEILITRLRADLFMLTWSEKNGNTVTQIQDHKEQTVYMNWSHPGGKFTHAKGTITPVK
jgi:hypothetical protein